jgi:hypothetical protein
MDLNITENFIEGVARHLSSGTWLGGMGSPTRFNTGCCGSAKQFTPCDKLVSNQWTGCPIPFCHGPPTWASWQDAWLHSTSAQVSAHY